MSAGSYRTLRNDLLALFRSGVDEALDEERFQELALAAFRHQVASNAVYAAFARGRGVAPDSVDRWTRIPPVPTAAFKELPLVSPPGGPDEAGDDEEPDRGAGAGEGDTGKPVGVAREGRAPRAVEAVFRTSGTSRGAARRGEHHVVDLDLYRESLRPNFRRHLLPDGARLRLLSLIPSPDEQPESSLSFMVGEVGEMLDGSDPVEYFVDGRGDLRSEDLRGALAAAEDAEEPVLVAGTAFAFVHWLDEAREGEWSFQLPEGSRVMETGGFKGRSRTVTRGELYGGLARCLGVAQRWIVNEYGMTELLSQFYDHTAGSSGPDPEARRHRGPPWVRTRVLDPETLAPVPDGTPGLLCHFDLANLGSVCHVLTEDLGVADGPGFRVLGRAPGAEPRGCSLAMDELLAAAGRSAGAARRVSGGAPKRRPGGDSGGDP